MHVSSLLAFEEIKQQHYHLLGTCPEECALFLSVISARECCICSGGPLVRKVAV